jgi:hypothetical protein
MLFGVNPASGFLLGALELETEKYPTGRFRDIYFEKNEDGIGGKVILYTRNGGGNREDYEHVFEALEKHPLYLNDYDDDFDCTYAYIEFTAPESVVEFFEDVETEKFDRVGARFQKEIAELQAGKEPNERLKTFMEGFIETLNTNK